MSSPTPSNWHARDGQECLDALHSSCAGLEGPEAQRRLERHGANRLPEAPGKGWLQRLLLQFHNLLIYVLLAAAVLVAALGEWLDSAVILGVVLINAVVGFVQEGKAEQAMRSIRGLLSLECRVRRNGVIQTLPAEQLVPGDIVLLDAGDRVPADLRLLDCRDLTQGSVSVPVVDLATRVAGLGMESHWRQAIVRPSDAFAAMTVDFWMAAANNRGITCRVFRDRESALAWLTGG